MESNQSTDSDPDYIILYESEAVGMKMTENDELALLRQKVLQLEKKEKARQAQEASVPSYTEATTETMNQGLALPQGQPQQEQQQQQQLDGSDHASFNGESSRTRGLDNIRLRNHPSMHEYEEVDFSRPRMDNSASQQHVGGQANVARQEHAEVVAVMDQSPKIKDDPAMSKKEDKEESEMIRALMAEMATLKMQVARQNEVKEESGVIRALKIEMEQLKSQVAKQNEDKQEEAQAKAKALRNEISRMKQEVSSQSQANQESDELKNLKAQKATLENEVTKQQEEEARALRAEISSLQSQVTGSGVEILQDSEELRGLRAKKTSLENKATLQLEAKKKMEEATNRKNAEEARRMSALLNEVRTTYNQLQLHLNENDMFGFQAIRQELLSHRDVLTVSEDEVVKQAKEWEPYLNDHLQSIDRWNVEIGEKVSFLVPVMKEKSAVYIGKNSDLDSFLSYYCDKDITALMFQWSKHSEKENAGIWEFFVDLCKNGKADMNLMFILVDAEEKGIQIDGDCIVQYSEGKITSDNVIEELRQYESYCTAKPTQFETGRMSTRSTTFEAPCPKYYSGICPGTVHKWKCAKCFETLEYGFDNYFYCRCGGAKTNCFQFRCSSPNHGIKYQLYKQATLTDIINNLKSFDGMTILILGETGVGKSTFINGFANYLAHYTLQDAVDAREILSPVKSQFSITNEKCDLIEITTGAEENEKYVTGASSTQSTRAHVFNFKGGNVRLIDTPGIGDTRGIHQDKENLDDILRYISYYEEIHGVCILLKPNNARLTVMFDFCIKELLIHLHKNAAKNIVFCFTNARGTLYKPGDTFPTLKKLIEENDDIPIKLCKDIIYCMDNESFRFLAAVKQGIEFEKDESELYNMSWKKAQDETIRMLTYLSQLQPHKVKDTVSVNDVRRKILDLTKPLAEIARQIDVTIGICEDRKKEIETYKKTADDIKAVICIQIPTLEPHHLDHPRTVCTSPQCSVSHVIDGQSMKQFNKFCHDHCQLKVVATDSINNPDLKRCAAMQASDGESCSNCGCSWNVHMHVTYDLVSVTKPGEDANAKARYKDVTSATEMKQIAMAELQETIRELEFEKNQIMEATAQFGYFLKKNSLLPYNDAMLGYLEYIIKQEEEKVIVSKDRTQLNSLYELKRSYEHEVRALKDCLNGISGGSFSSKSQEEIIQQLYEMKHFGDNLRGIFQSLSLFRLNKIRLEEVEYTTEKKQSYGSSLKKGATKIYQYVKKKLPSFPYPSEATRHEPHYQAGDFGAPPSSSSPFPGRHNFYEPVGGGQSGARPKPPGRPQRFQPR